VKCEWTGGEWPTQEGVPRLPSAEGRKQRLLALAPAPPMLAHDNSLAGKAPVTELAILCDRKPAIVDSVSTRHWGPQTSLRRPHSERYLRLRRNLTTPFAPRKQNIPDNRPATGRGVNTYACCSRLVLTQCEAVRLPRVPQLYSTFRSSKRATLRASSPIRPSWPTANCRRVARRLRQRMGPRQMLGTMRLPTVGCAASLTCT
jgi:hypothetical protein